MKTFKNKLSLINAFYEGVFTEGCTRSICNNYFTDFKNDKKYKFIGNVYYENAKPKIFINRKFKVAIIMVDACGVYVDNDITSTYKTYYLFDSQNHLDFIKNHFSRDTGFLSCMRYCATMSYIETLFYAKRAAEKKQCNSRYLLQNHFESKKQLLDTNKLCKALSKEHKIPNVIMHFRGETPIRLYKGNTYVYDYVKYCCQSDSIQRSYALNKFEFISLLVQSLYYEFHNSFTNTSLGHTRSEFYEYYTNRPTKIAHLVHNILSNHNVRQNRVFWNDYLRTLKRYNLVEIVEN